MQLDPDVATTTLDNGLAVTTVALPHLHTAVCALFIKVGSRFESPKDNGLSHFVEHMLFRGTERYATSLALNTAVEQLGSTLHAETGRDYTLFQLGLEPIHVAAGIDLLGELLARPRFSDIELERKLILEELKEDFDEAGVEINADDIARGLAFDDHPLGQRIIGPRTNVERFAADDVRRHFSTFYGATNAHLCVTGPIDHTEVVDRAARAFATMPAGERAVHAPAPIIPTDGPRLRHVSDAGSQTSLAVLFRAIPELDRRYVALVALLRVLDDGMSTRLHYTIADQKALAYSIHAAIEPLADTALFEIAGQTANAKVPALVRETLQLLDTLRRGAITDDELAKARVRYRYETRASIDDASAMAGWFGGTALYYEPPTLSTRLEAMSRVTIDDMVDVARDVLDPNHLAIAAVGTLSRARLSELRGVVSEWR
ncbi:MAG: insulinase family protein [Deltaproteobacteria bacterium]|nr:insulinase family protein [Deltaproteobacteria bacterium]